MRLIDADALRQVLEVFTEKDTLGHTPLQLCDAMPTAPRWHRVEEELPDDGEWAIFTNGKVVTVERFKEDAYNHFFPASRWFDFEDAIAWMPLPEPPKEDA